MKRGTPEHSKMRRLRRTLDLRQYEAMGLLEALWHLAAREAPRGDIGKLSDEAICDSLDWARDGKTLIDALVDCGWLDKCLDNRLVIHDWVDHCDDAVKKKVGRDKLGGFAVVRRCPPESADVRQRQPALAEPLPEPSQAAPAPQPAAAATMPQDAPTIDPRLTALDSIGMGPSTAMGLLRRFQPTEAEVENYVERSRQPGVNNRLALCQAAIREKWPIEAVPVPMAEVQRAVDDRAAAEGMADGLARAAARKAKAGGVA